MHVFRWDLDKTYLETSFSSVRGLMRAALEPAAHKRNVPGSAALLRGLVHCDPTCRVAIVSGSPTQMRATLEEKLALDGIRVDSLVLKDNLGNLRRGRLRAVTGQVGYKLPVLLQQRISLGPDVTETLFGDDAEVDAVVYSAYADAVAGRLDGSALAEVMRAGKAYPDNIEAAVEALGEVEAGEAVEDIFIRLNRATPVSRFRVLGPRVVPVYSWLQAAMVLWHRGRLTPSHVVEVARACMEEAELGERAIAGLAQDLVRRGHISGGQVRDLFDAAPGLGPMSDAVVRALDRLGAPPRPPPAPDVPQYVAFLRASR